MNRVFITSLALLAACHCSLCGAQPGQKLWEFEPVWGSSSPAIGADGTVFVAGGDKTVYALDGTTGQTRWEFYAGSNLTHSSPAISSDGMLYVGAFGVVYALNGATGQKVWEFPTGGPVNSSPAIAANGTVYVGCDDGIVYALDGATGQKVWGYSTAGVVFSSPAIGSNGTVYVASSEYIGEHWVGQYRGIVYALNGTTGQKIWDFWTGDVVNSSPALGADGTVYIGSQDAKVYALDGATGNPKWLFSTLAGVDSSPAIGPDGTVYVGSGDHKVYALNPATGWKVWEFLTAGQVNSSPAVGADGTIYVASNAYVETYDGTVYALNGATGQKNWEFDTEAYVGSSPAIGTNGTVYVQAVNGKLYALTSRSVGGIAQGPWPKFRGDAWNSGRVNTRPVMPPPVHFMTNQVIVSSLAGSGDPGYADGTGTNPQFNFPNGGFVDRAGNVYIADRANHRIRKVTPEGMVSTVAGTGVAGYADGPAASSQFSNPMGVCVDAAGTVFVADAGNNRVRKLSDDGQVSTIAGSGAAGYQDGAGTAAWLNYPNDLVVDGAGNLFVTEFNNHTVRRIAPDGTVSTWSGNGAPGYLDGPRASAQFNQPAGIALDRDSNLYVTEWGGQRVRKISACEVSTVAGSGVAGYLDRSAPNAQFNNPDGAVVDGEGNLYIADNGNHVIRRISPEGVVETAAGTGVAGFADGEGFEAQFLHPAGLGMDVQGDLYVADSGNHSVRKIVIAWPLVITPEMVVRQLPANYVPGTGLVVSLDAKPPAHTTSYTVEDHSPIGWAVSSISDGGSFDPADGLVRFGPFFDSQPRTLSYVVLPPPNANGVQQFAGSFSVNGERSSISGVAEVGPEAFYPTDRYRVIWNSTLTETCTNCGRPVVTYPLRGTAELRYSSSMAGTTWTFVDVQMDTVSAAPRHYHITGSGNWSGGGQFCFPACYTVLYLGLQIDDGTTNKLCTFYQRNLGTVPDQPILTAGAPQIDGTPSQTFSILLSFAPVQDLWFSTRCGLTSASMNSGSGRVENGDVLADSGRVVKRNAALLQPFGVAPNPAAGGYDIDALSVAPGGEIVFSLRNDVLSPTSGLLRHGDLLSDRGRIVKTNPELLESFVVQPPVPDAGLDGVEILDNNVVLFSLTTNVFSEKLGVMLTSGDLLADNGLMLYSNQQLLAALRPNPNDQNYGLAAFHVWRGRLGLPGEVWFCTERGFDSALGPIGSGDLISSAGYIVYRNLELVANFQPLEDLANFGLDGLFLVLPRQGAPSARLAGAITPSGLLLRWETTGRVSQVERSSDISGPYFQPASPIVPGLDWLDTSVFGAKTPFYYRLRIW